LKDLDEDEEFSLYPEQRKQLRSRMADLDYRPQPNSTSEEPTVNKRVSSQRALLLAEIQEKLLKFDRFSIKARKLTKFQRPSDRDSLGLRT
jgi:hypothetical protein